MDDYSSPLSETLRIGYLDTRRVGHFCLARGTAPFVFLQSRGNPPAPGVNPSKQHSIGYLLRNVAHTHLKEDTRLVRPLASPIVSRDVLGSYL